MPDSIVIVSIKIDQAALNRFLSAEMGPMGRYMRFVGEAAKKEAKSLAKRRLVQVGGPRAVAGTYPGQENDWHRPANRTGADGKTGRPPGRTGEYDKNFHSKTIRRVGSITLNLYNDSKYAAIVEKGSDPAFIFHRSGKRLNYWAGSSTGAGTYVWTAPGEGVLHPGAFGSHQWNRKVNTKGANILRDAARYAVKLQYTYLIP